MAFVEDLSLFFVDTGFGDKVIVDGIDTRGVFFNEGEEVNGVITERPEVHLELAEVPNVARGSVIEVKGVTYSALVPIPDGLGLAVVPLEET